VASGGKCTLLGHCIYTNKFSNSMECRDYVGEWSEQDAKEDCEDQGSTVVLGSACGMEERLGYCFLEKAASGGRASRCQG
jgi:hypothetical protein